MNDFSRFCLTLARVFEAGVIPSLLIAGLGASLACFACMSALAILGDLIVAAADGTAGAEKMEAHRG